MPKLSFIYNPFAGNHSVKNNLDTCIQSFQSAGFHTDILRMQEDGDVARHMARIAGEGCDAVVVSGGDGSIHLVVNEMLREGINAPLGIIPSGTANDFASFLKLPSDPGKAAELIGQGKRIKIDVGLASGPDDRQYFINVCAGGMFTNISQTVDVHLKNTFGKLAYYAKGLEQLPSFEPMSVRITHSRASFQESLLFFFALNSAGTGGFENLSPGAEIDDGLFDFIGFRDMPLHELALLFVKVLRGDYLDDKNIVFFRDSNILVERMDEPSDPFFLGTDLDGESGPSMPVEIRNIKQSLEIFIP